MDTLDKIYDMMYCELDDIAKKDKLDSKDVELIDKFVDIIKDIDDIGKYSDMGGYSQMNGGYSRGRSYRMMPMYDNGRSMNNGYSHTNNKDVLINRLRDVADMAVDDRDGKAIQTLIDQMSRRA